MQFITVIIHENIFSSEIVHSFSLTLCLILYQSHPLLQIFETLLVQNFYKLRLKILVTVPRPTSHWPVRLQVVQHVHFLLWGLSIKANKKESAKILIHVKNNKICKDVWFRGPHHLTDTNRREINYLVNQRQIIKSIHVPMNRPPDWTVHINEQFISMDILYM